MAILVVGDFAEPYSIFDMIEKEFGHLEFSAEKSYEKSYEITEKLCAIPPPSHTPILLMSFQNNFSKILKSIWTKICKIHQNFTKLAQITKILKKILKTCASAAAKFSIPLWKLVCSSLVKKHSKILADKEWSTFSTRVWKLLKKFGLGAFFILKNGPSVNHFAKHFSNIIFSVISVIIRDFLSMCFSSSKKKEHTNFGWWLSLWPKTKFFVW